MGVRGFFGSIDSDDFDRVFRPTFVEFVRPSGEVVGPLDPASHLSVNGVSIADPDYETPFEAGGVYELTFGLDDIRVEQTLRAPSVSAINFESLPDSVDRGGNLTVSWRYPEGEANDGAILVETRGYSSGLLPPSTTEHTFPVSEFESERVQVSVTSVRYVRFPNLITPDSRDVELFEPLDRKAAYFGIAVGINRYVGVRSE